MKPKQIHLSDNTFKVILHKAYYSGGFFNVKRENSEKFGEDGVQIKIQLGDNEDNFIFGEIDRRANENGTPRIRGRKMLTEWIQDNFQQGNLLNVEVCSPTFIVLTKQFK